MKKSFLITLAAVSSVALIGCSSDSDKGNGGGGEPQFKITADKVDSTSEYVVNIVKPANEEAKKLLGQAGATDVKDALSCGSVDKSNIEVMVVEDVVTIGLKKSALGTGVSCNATGIVSGINFSEENNVSKANEKKVNAFIADSLVDEIAIADGQAKTYDLKLEGAVKYTYGSNKFTRTSTADENTAVTITPSGDDVKGLLKFACGETTADKAGAIKNCKVTVTPGDKAVSGSIAFGEDAKEKKESFGSIAVNVAAKDNTGGGDTAITVEAVADAHSTSGDLKNIGVIKNANITAETVLKCSADATGTTLKECDTTQYPNLKIVATAGALYFTSDAIKNGAEHFALAGKDGKLLAGTLPTADAVSKDQAISKKQYINATKASAAAANVDAAAVNQAVTNNTLVIGTAQHSALVLLERTTTDLFKYHVDSGDSNKFKRDAATAPTGIKVALNKIGDAATEITPAAGSTTDATGQGIDACSADNTFAKCLLKVTTGASWTASSTNDIPFVSTPDLKEKMTVKQAAQ